MLAIIYACTGSRIPGTAAAPEIGRSKGEVGVPAVFSIRRRDGHWHGSVWLLLLLASSLAPTVVAETVRLGGTGSAMGSMAKLAEAYQHVDPSFRLEIVPNLGSSGGIKALQRDLIDLAASGRPLKPEESATRLQAHVYGVTPFVIATAKEGVDQLTTTQLAAFYSGRIAHWPDGRSVRLVLRPANDTDTPLLASLSPAIKSALAIAMARDGMVVAMTDQDSVDAIERLPGGLGTSTLAQLRSESRRARALVIDGVEPTVENLSNGRYRFAKTMYLIAKDCPSASVAGFLAFVRSEPGRNILAEIGHVSTAEPAAASPCAGMRRGR